MQPAARSHVRTEKLLERLDLEVKLRDIVIRLPLFCCFIACFLLAWRSSLPPDEHYAVRRRLDASFGLARVDGVTSLEGVYSFMQEFGERHKALHSLDPSKWCEERFFGMEWDSLGALPRYTCSRRKFAPLSGSVLLPEGAARRMVAQLDVQDYMVGAGGESSSNETVSVTERDVVYLKPTILVSFKVLGIDYNMLMDQPVLVDLFRTAVAQTIASVLPDVVTRESISVDLSSGSVKVVAAITPPPTLTAAQIYEALVDNQGALMRALLAAIKAIPGIDAVTYGEISIVDFRIEQVGPSCYDYDEVLMSRLGRSLNCTEASPEVCGLDVGVTLCPVTCDLCGPYRYKRLAKHTGPMTTVLPAVAYQSRYETTECAGFAAQYDAQAANPDLFTQPPMDGSRTGSLTTCVNRDKPLDTAFAVEVACPSGSCDDDLHRDTPKWNEKIRGQIVYPRLLTSLVDDLARFRAVQWLDAQTGVISMSSLVYTEGIEMFTALTIEFHIDGAGSVSPEVHCRSWKVLSTEEGGWLTGYVLFGIFFLVLSFGHTLFRIKSDANLSGADSLEILTRLSMLAMFVALPAWKQLDQDDCAKSFEDAINVYSDVKDPASTAGSAKVLTAFFAAIAAVEQKAKESDNMSFVCFAVMCVQAIQLLYYLHMHPRTGILTATAKRALERSCYLLLFFLPLFFFLSFLAFWMFGAHLDSFDSYGEALATHVRMLFGEFLQAPGAVELEGSNSGMYWFHAVVFMALFFILLRFVFLAVVIDAYVAAKRERSVVAHSAPYDLVDSWLAWGKFRSLRWPFQAPLARQLRKQLAGREEAETSSDEAGVDALADLQSALEAFEREDAAVEADRILEYYIAKVPAIVTPVVEANRGAVAQAGALQPAEKTYPKLDPKRVTQKVVAEVTNILADKQPEELDRFVTIGMLSSVISREFRACGLVS